MSMLENFTFEEMTVGQTASYTRAVTEEDVLLFAAVSGDTNPVHLDEEFASGTQFKGRIAHGMYTAGLISAAIAMELPQRVTVEIVETEPVTKGQTASSSYKPAICSNGIRVMVPPHIGAGIRIVINTEDRSYQERAKD